MTYLRELAPFKSVVPTNFVKQSVAVEYSEEYIIVEAMDSRALDLVSSFGCWGWSSYVSCELTTVAMLSGLGRLTYQLARNSWHEGSSTCLTVKSANDIRQLEEKFKVFLASDRNRRPTDWDLPHTKFTVTRWLLSVTMHSVNSISLHERDQNLAV